MKRLCTLLCVAVLACFSLAVQAAGLACGKAPTLPASSILLLGEMHGSVESPPLVARLICARASRGPVALGLELPADEHAAINRFLASDGGAIATQQLLSRDFWEHDTDGRASTAMLQLLERVRQLRHLGAPITLFTFSEILPGKTYDASIAQDVRTFHTAHPALPIVALMGNVHANPQPFQAGPNEILTAAYLLRDLHPTSVLLAYPSGTIWACMPKCGVHPVASHWGNARKPGLHKGSPMGLYASSYVLRNITASQPAISGDAGRK